MSRLPSAVSILSLGISLVAVSPASALIMSVTELSALSYSVVVTNDGSDFDVSPGNDTLSFSSSAGAVMNGSTVDTDGTGLGWERNPAASNGNFETIFIDGGTISPWSSGTSITFELMTTQAITSLTLDYLFELGSIDSVTETVISPVPEPGTWALWIGGVALIGAVMRRRKRV